MFTQTQTYTHNQAGSSFNTISNEIRDAVICICNWIIARENGVRISNRNCNAESIQTRLNGLGLTACVRLRVRYNQPQLVVSLSGVEHSYDISASEWRIVRDASSILLTNNLSIPWLEVSSHEVHRNNFCAQYIN